MIVDPDARAVLDQLAALVPGTPIEANDDRWLTDFRYKTALITSFDLLPAPLHDVSHVILPGDPPLAIRLYRPSPGLLPVLIHMHGGGAIAGSVDGHDACLRALAARTGWLVAAPLYRLAPEHRFPAQVEDGWRALTGLSERANDLVIDRDRIVLSGDSVGATFALTLLIRARDEGGPRLAGQILLYPNADMRTDVPYPSRRREDGNIIGLSDLKRQIDLTLAGPEDRTLGAASPILIDTLAGLSPTLLVTCGADPLCDEGEALVRRLIDAGVAVEHRRYDGMIHAFLQMGGRIEATARLLDEIADWLS